MILLNLNGVYVWYTFGICLVYKNDQKIWLWLKMSDQILIILVDAQYTKNIWYMNCYTACFVKPTVCSIPEATRYDYFWLVYNWYMKWWYKYNDLFLFSGDLVSYNNLQSAWLVKWYFPLTYLELQIL